MFRTPDTTPTTPTTSDSGRPRRWRRTLVTVATTGLLVAPAAVWAADGFTDVPDSNVFHDDINWMADNGVTKGCNPPANTEYCPKDNVTREQMAAFMHRLQTEDVFAPADHQHTALFGTATSPLPSQHNNTTFADLSGASTTVEVPAGHEATIIARFSAASACYGDNGWCAVRLLVNGTEMAPVKGINSVFDSSDQNTESGASSEGHVMERVSTTLPSGTHTVTVQVAVFNSSALNFYLGGWTLVAEGKLTS